MYKFLLFIFLFFNSTLAMANIHYPQVSQDKMAGQLFDKAMLNYYGYLYVQAEYDFRQALVYDPHCGLCYWGLALSKKQEALEQGLPFSTVGLADMQKAEQLVSTKNKFAYELVQASKQTFSLNNKLSAKQLQINYINALRKLYQHYKNEESLALLVDAIAYYPAVTVQADEMPHNCGNVLDKDYQAEAIPLIASALNKGSHHPGLLHTYIHLNEGNLTDPLNALAAQELPKFSRGQIAHYTHMANHIYWRRGMYDQAIQANLDAIAIDKQYFKQGGIGLNAYYYEFHYLHSYQFLAALGMLSNRPDLALENARALKQLLDSQRMQGMKDTRDQYLSLEHLVLARFKQWKAVLELQTPEQTQELGLLLIRFSKALAYLHLGKAAEFQQGYDKINRVKYSRSNLRELKTLVLTYLQASEMNLHGAALQDLEILFKKNNVSNIENKLFSMNPPLWYFPHTLFLSAAAAQKNNLQAAKQYHEEYEKLYPHSSMLG